jgi:hypothetical protein
MTHAGGTAAISLPTLNPLERTFFMNDHPSNFVTFRPKKSFIRFEPRLANSPETQDRLEAAGLVLMDYDKRWGRYRIKLEPGDVEKHKPILQEIMAEAYTDAKKE